jgi:DNA/RNA endonuclease G (NUC1)
VGDIDGYMSRFKGLFRGALAKVKRDTEESEAIKGLKLAAATLAETAGQPDVVVITDPNVKEQKVTVEMPPIEVPEEFTEAVKELKETAEKIAEAADKPAQVVVMPGKDKPADIKVDVHIPDEKEEIVEVVERDKDGKISKIRKTKK